ncbi:MAG: FG-GAP repeat domain-containing protein [Pirellula sp.]
MERTQSKQPWLLGVLVALLAIAGGIGYWRFSQKNEEETRVRALGEQFEKSVRAASYLENIQYDQSAELYAELRRMVPTEPAYLRNTAIAMLADVKYQMDLMQDPKNDVEKIRRSLPELFDRAAAVIEAYRKANPDDPIAYQLDVLRDLRWIAVLNAANPIIADEEQSKLLDKLQTYVDRFPTNAFLVTQYNNAAETVSAVDPEILKRTVKPLREVVAAHPRNIYLLCLLIQRLVQLKDPSAIEYVEPLANLLGPFEWKWKMERRPKDLNDLRRATELAKTDLDGALGLLIGWVGEAKSTEGSLVDAKSIDISELAFLDMSDIKRMLQDADSDVPDLDMPEFTAKELSPTDVRGVRFLDWNVDTRPELLVWTDKKLLLGEVDAAQGWKELAALPLPASIEGVLAADLFAVAAHRGTLARPIAGQADREAQLATAVRHETLRDLLLYGNDGIALVSFEPPVEATPHWNIVAEDVGLNDLKSVRSMMPIDWESDGDLDLAVISQGRLRLRENMGNRQFRDVDSVSTLPPETVRVTAIAVVDYDRDVELDILLAHSQGFGVMENIQHGQFRYRELSDAWTTLGSAGSLAVGDFNNNYSWDVLAGKVPSSDTGSATQTGTGLQLVSTITQFGKSVAAPVSFSLIDHHAYVAAADWNNDAILDFFSGTELGLTAWINRRGLMFASVPIITPESIPQTESAAIDSTDPHPLWQVLSVGDVGNDGWLDVAYTYRGHLFLVTTQPKPDHHSLRYRVKGISDANGGGRNNQYCVGATVELYGPFGYQARVIEDDSVHFGLGADAAYSLRTIFVNGLTQGIIDPKSDSILEEEQVLIGSCPFAYGWDGQSWQMITDLLWNAPLGLQVAKGRVLPDRRWEYLMLPRQFMQPLQNAYEIRITEELWETAYFDHVALLAIDHPAEVEILSNEKVGPASIAEPKLWQFRESFPAKSVIDSKGRDWTAALQQEDGQYAIPFERFYKQGLVEDAWLEFDFGAIDSTRPAQLILHGWIHPTDTSLNIGIDQNPDLSPPAPPKLLTVGSDGAFEVAIPFTGFPGGKPKTIVIPLDGVFRTADHRIRIQHSSCIYWDRARIGYGESMDIPTSKRGANAMEAEGLRASWLPLQSSQLSYRGFSRALPRERHQPHWYDYEDVSTATRWPPLGGRFTRYGDTLSLLQFDDDALVVLAPGDEVALRFGMPSHPLPEGWVRDWVMHNVGWDKDAALNTLEGQSSLPLPFSSMSQYPPGMDDAETAAKIERMHRATLTREMSRERFWRPREPSESRENLKSRP